MNDRFDFDSARPVWERDREHEKNVQLGFRAVFEAASGSPATLRCAASAFYRVWLNGRFVGYGPARCARGFFRVDEWDLGGFLQTGPNLLAIEAVGYNVNSYAAASQPSFLQAEVVARGHVLASTAGDGVPFQCLDLQQRVQRVQRYSFQRPFIEVYRFGAGYDLWRRDLDARPEEAELQEMPPVQCLRRGSPRPKFEYRLPVAALARGRAEARAEGVLTPWRDRCLTRIGPGLQGFAMDELELTVSDDLQKLADTEVRRVDDPDEAEDGVAFRLAAGAWTLLDFGANQTGFVGVRVHCEEALRLQVLFDEILDEGRLDFLRMDTVNAVTWFLEPGDYVLESIEPYVFRYLKVLALHGACEVEGVYLRELACPDADTASFLCSDPELEEIFEAGRETFRQNAVDIFMDCPSRERAGWLCDSFYTGRVERVLRGNSAIERDFLENFLLPARFDPLPAGMLPMCYPADHPVGQFIPNWPLWLTLELEDYLRRSGDDSLVAAFQSKIMALFAFLDGFLNEDGLLESLPGWIFVEWSEANKFVRDVNFPSNMLYAAALDAAGRIYADASLCQRAAAMRRTVREQSFDGRFFVDNAVRGADGVLARTANRTETCQYYAFAFGVADREGDAELWERMRSAFGPGRNLTRAFPEVHPANMLMGNCLRLDLLSQAGDARGVLQSLKAYFLQMARTTGTLWEHNDTRASCNHAFASYAVCCLYRDILGCRIDEWNRVVRLRLGDLPLKSCLGVIPLSEGTVQVQWEKSEDTVICRVRAPQGYRFDLENQTDLKLDFRDETPKGTTRHAT